MNLELLEKDTNGRKPIFILKRKNTNFWIHTRENKKRLQIRAAKLFVFKSK